MFLKPSRCFGDHRHLFLLKMRSPIAEAPVPAVQRAWAVRARDGVAVAIPDALPVLNKRSAFLGTVWPRPKQVPTIPWWSACATS